MFSALGILVVFWEASLFKPGGGLVHEPVVLFTTTSWCRAHAKPVWPLASHERQGLRINRLEAKRELGGRQCLGRSIKSLNDLLDELLGRCDSGSLHLVNPVHE